MMLQGGCDADGGIVTQALLQRTALQPVHRHDYVQLIHGCVMTRACSRQSRVVYGKLFWTGETSQARPCDTIASATVVRPDALPCPPFLGSSVVPPPKLERVSKLLCLPLVEANVP